MFNLHPVIQVLATCLGIYVLYLGWLRAQSRHFGRKTVFPWKRHVFLGRLAILLWLSGALFAFGITWGYYGKRALEGHGLGGMVFAFLILMIYVSGFRLNKPQRRAGNSRNNRLPMLHGLLAFAAVVLAVLQITGGAMMMFGTF